MPVSDNEVISVTDVPVGITSSKLTNTNGSSKWVSRATFYVANASIRITRQEGVEPDNDTNLGLVIPVGTLFSITGSSEIVNLRMIQTGDDPATVYVDLEQD